MKVYCKLCDKVQPVFIDNCRDAKTNEPFQDIVCKKCHLVIASGTDIQLTWVGLTDEEMMQIYIDLKSVAGFYSVEKYARAIEAKLKEKNNG